MALLQHFYISGQQSASSVNSVRAGCWLDLKKWLDFDSSTVLKPVWEVACHCHRASCHQTCIRGCLSLSSSVLSSNLYQRLLVTVIRGCLSLSSSVLSSNLYQRLLVTVIERLVIKHVCIQLWTQLVKLLDVNVIFYSQNITLVTWCECERDPWSESCCLSLHHSDCWWCCVSIRIQVKKRSGCWRHRPTWLFYKLAIGNYSLHSICRHQLWLTSSAGFGRKLQKR